MCLVAVVEVPCVIGSGYECPLRVLQVLFACSRVLQLFLEGMLRRFLQEADHLLGMTSDDADKVREAEAAALREAKEEAASGGVKVGGEDALMVRGEDVLTQVTHGLVCLLRVRSALLDTVNALGFVPKVGVTVLCCLTVVVRRLVCGCIRVCGCGLRCVPAPT